MRHTRRAHTVLQQHAGFGCASWPTTHADATSDDVEMTAINALDTTFPLVLGGKLVRALFFSLFFLPWCWPGMACAAAATAAAAKRGCVIIFSFVRLLLKLLHANLREL